MPATTPATHAPANRLADETSPYLLQHKHNPVHWMPWGPAAFERSVKEDKPILLSIGYAACHWCHVMAHESFEDDAIAALMNELFVSIKVDREERPDIDHIYQHALALLGEQGGWPLTMFLTPQREPFWGGTYFPPEDRYGRPGFPNVLQRISEIYHSEGDKIAKNVAALTGALGEISAAKPGDGVAPETLDQVAQHYLRQVDTVHGGLGGAPKFPQCAVFDLLWRAWKRTGADHYRNAVLVTLDRMCQGGIYDHLGGGFARYSTDAVWLAPHFEKMLYDNAQLVELLTHAWLDTRSALYATRIEETVGWLLREMVLPGGGFAGTLDADSEGEEGKFYVWSKAEIKHLLGDEAAAFAEAYDVRDGGNWESKTILNRTHKPILGSDVHEEFLTRCRIVLLEAREKRIRPSLDDKVLADWNGLMIAALAFAGRVFGRQGWIEAAAHAYDFIRAEMVAGGRLKHSWREGRAAHPATLDDHVALARAAVALFEATGDDGYLQHAEEWAEEIEVRFGDPQAGGYFLSADDVDDILLRTKSAFDNATPSGNGLLTHLFAKLHYLTGKPEYRERGEALVRAFSGELQRNALGIPVLLTGSEALRDMVQVVLCGDAGDDAMRALADAVWQTSTPNRVVQSVADGAALPPGHPAHGKQAAGAGAAAFVCRGTTCSLPITDPDALVSALAET